MCGIAGSLGSAEPVPAILRALGHRGPDHLGWEGRERWALGATRLRITGGLGGDMPLRSRSGRVVLVANGQIFNHRSLYPCEAGGSDLSGLADLIEAEGCGALSRLRGPFALIAWDQEEETLLLARDEFGVRPLFYSEDSSGLRVASEVEALLPKGSGFDPDPDAWAHLLAFQFWPVGKTLHRGVSSLPPGRWRRFRQGAEGLEVESGTFKYRGKPPASLREAMVDSFALQGASASRRGICLSGGLDSSAVAGGLVAAGQAPELAVVGWFPGAPSRFDERPWARAVASELGIRLIEVAITPERYLAAWPETLRHLGGPLAGPGSVSQWLLAEALGKEGVRVVFTGQGGDEVFGGYERHRLLLQGDLGLPVVPAPGYEPLARILKDRGPAALVYRGEEILALLEPRWRSRVEALVRPLRELVQQDGASAQGLLDFEIRSFLPGLLAVDDRAFGAFGLEGRVPLLDPALAALARGYPLAERSPPQASRALFRQACGQSLPRAVAARKDKMGFPIPLAQWFEGPWRCLLQDPPGASRLLDVGFLPGTLAALRAGRLHPRSSWFLLSCAIYLHSRDSGAREETSAR